MTDVYLPSNTSNSRCTWYMRTRLRFRWTVTVANRGSGTTNSNQYRMYRTWLHLTTTDDRLRSTARFSTASSFRALVHVQLTRLHRATTASCGTATPGTLYTSPHPLHSTTGVRLINARPTPLDILDSLRLYSANFDSQRHPHFSLTLTIRHRVLTPSDARASNLPLHVIFLRRTRGINSACITCNIFFSKCKVQCFLTGLKIILAYFADCSVRYFVFCIRTFLCYFEVLIMK